MLCRAIPNKDFACVFCSTGEFWGRNGAAKLQADRKTGQNFLCSFLEMQRHRTAVGKTKRDVSPGDS